MRGTNRGKADSGFFKGSFRRFTLPMAAGLLLVFLIVAVAVGGGVIYRPATDNLGNQGNGSSQGGSVSADGRFVIMESNASNLVPGDTNAATDIFFKDTSNGIITRISTDTAGSQANGASRAPAISPDGQYVVFESDASNLVPGDTNGATDVFVKHVWTGALTRVSVSSAGAQANGSSDRGVISADGQKVTFRSLATNLVSGDTNGFMDVFWHDQAAGTTVRVSTDSTGVQADAASSGHYRPFISADGRYAAFESDATNLVPGDTNALSDIFVKDTLTGTTARVSTSALGVEANGPSYVASISEDGRYVAFRSMATNLYPLNGPNCNPWNCSDVFVKDTQTGTVFMGSSTDAGTPADSASWDPIISADGRYVSFSTDASNLEYSDTSGNYDIFVKDIQGGGIELVSKDAAGNEGNSWSIEPFVSYGGGYVTFFSSASNLVPGDTNGVHEVFLSTVDGACSGTAPGLTLSKGGVYWASMADYTAGLLSVDYNINNPGSYPVVAADIAGSTATAGVTLATATPVSLGNISGGSSASATLKYSVPQATVSFLATVYISGMDGCGASYAWPGPYPGP